MPTRKTSGGFTAEERAAMQERARELKARGKGSRGSTKIDGEGEVLAKIAAMETADRVLAEKIHALVKANAPQLTAKTWYGMPAYARDGKIVCFFKAAAKFKDRYATFGFNDEARLDDGNVWPTTFALTKLTRADEATLAELIKKAIR